MRLSADSYKILGKWIDGINEETGNPKNFPTKIAFARAYIKNSYNFVVKNFSYDFGARNYLSQFKGQAVYHEKYREYTSLENFIQGKAGICKQFASLLCVFTANEKSSLQQFKFSVAPSMLACNLIFPDKKIVGHAINSYKLYGNMLFCDPTMQKSYKKSDFLLKTKQDLQNEYLSARDCKIYGFVSNIEIKTKNIQNVCNLFSDYNFKPNDKSKDYQMTTFLFN